TFASPETRHPSGTPSPSVSRAKSGLRIRLAGFSAEAPAAAVRQTANHIGTENRNITGSFGESIEVAGDSFRLSLQPGEVKTGLFWFGRFCSTVVFWWHWKEQGLVAATVFTSPAPTRIFSSRPEETPLSQPRVERGE